MEDYIYEGTVVPMNIGLNYKIEKEDIELYAFCSPNKLVPIPKELIIKIDDSNYMFWVDTSLTGSGCLRFALAAKVLDDLYPQGDNKRLEVIEFESGYTVIKSVIKTFKK